MAMNLRLPPDLADALRGLADQTGRSQQEIARDAIAEYLRDYRLRAYPKEVRALLIPAQDPDEGAPSWGGLDGAELLASLLKERGGPR